MNTSVHFLTLGARANRRQRMTWLFMMLAAWFLAIETASIPAATVSWIGASGNWNTPANWSAGALPGPADDVIINVPGNQTVTCSSGSFTVNSIQCQEDFILSGGTLSISSASQFDASLTLSDGTLTGGGDVTITGTLNWTGGTMSGSGRTIIASIGKLNLRVSSGFLSRVLQNDGAAMWTGGPLFMSGGTINNNGSFTANGDPSFQGNGLGPNGIAANSFNNNSGATFTKLGANTAYFTKYYATGVSFNNSGSVNISEGTLQLDSGGANNGAISLAAGTTLTLATGGIDFPIASVFKSEVGSTLRLSAGSLTGAITSADHYVPNGRLLIGGGGPKQLEVMSRDLGNISAGFTANFAYGTLELAGGVNVTLVDNADNSPSRWNFC
jgi:hypothetical protein